MPIKPIDLQTLFMQFGQVGRQQAAEKEGLILQQALQGNAAAKKEAEEAKTVKRVDEEQSGAAAIRADEGNEGGKKHPEGHRNPKDEQEAGKETVKDPDLGGHIDISG